jgi:hypothetical protein
MEDLKPTKFELMTPSDDSHSSKGLMNEYPPWRTSTDGALALFAGRLGRARIAEVAKPRPNPKRRVMARTLARVALMGDRMGAVYRRGNTVSNDNFALFS